MKFEYTEVWGFKHAIRGMRNPMNSWHLSDSEFTAAGSPICIGGNDIDLMKRLINGGVEHRKFMRQIFVSVDIVAPLYWWKEFDTYTVGVTKNSCSTMHKLASTPITIDCFEVDDMNSDISEPEELIEFLERMRKEFNKTGDKAYWKELIRWLPNSWLQRRTCTMTYENVYKMVHERKNHKLNEWSGKDNGGLENFISWARSLPLADVLIFDEPAVKTKTTGVQIDNIKFDITRQPTVTSDDIKEAVAKLAEVVLSVVEDGGGDV